MFFGWPLSNEMLLALIAGQQRPHAEWLAQFEQIPVPSLEQPGIDRMRMLWRLTLELGIALEKTYLVWLDQCAAAVAALPNTTNAVEE